MKEACVGADVLIGVSSDKDVFHEDNISWMNDKPIIILLGSPHLEIEPSEVKKIKPDAIIATCRPEFPNYINSVMCTPFLFRAALDTRARKINNKMKLAAA